MNDVKKFEIGFLSSRKSFLPCNYFALCLKQKYEICYNLDKCFIEEIICQNFTIILWG